MDALDAWRVAPSALAERRPCRRDVRDLAGGALPGGQDRADLARDADRAHLIAPPMSCRTVPRFWRPGRGLPHKRMSHAASVAEAQ